jgi:eukaryotic-like serine/threonine-protein kinase
MDPLDTGELRLGGRTLDGRYLLETEVASGGMGTVWRGRDEVLGRPVAIKVLHEGLAGDPDILERFRREAVAAARLTHPNVVRVFDTGIDDGVCFIVMELFEGTTLEDRLRDGGPLPPAEAARMLSGILRGLAHAHREGVVHRDVKPGNVLLDRDGHVKVTDFGIAKAAFATSDLTTTGDLLGTARYLAPEQVAGGSVDHRADLYACGIVLYECLTGRTPFEADSHIATATMRLADTPKPPGALRPGIPRRLESVTMRALAREPEERFQSADEMNSALGPAAPPGGAGPVARPAPEDHRRGSAFRSWVAIPLILIAVAAAAVGGVLLLASAFDDSPQEPAAAEPEETRPIPISAATSFDPSPGDGEEHDADLPSAIDGNPDTAWQTEGYSTPDLGGAKPGVGIVFDLGNPRTVGSLVLQTDSPGYSFSVFAGDDATSFEPEASSPLSSTEGETSFTAEDGLELALEPVRARYVMIWITELVEQDGYRALVNEADFFAPGG